MERLKPSPGFTEKCTDCRRQSEKPVAGFFCKTAWAPAPLGYVLQPKIEVGVNGSIICDRYGPKLSVLIKNLVNRISAFAISRGIQLPQ